MEAETKPVTNPLNTPKYSEGDVEMKEPNAMAIQNITKIPETDLTKNLIEEKSEANIKNEVDNDKCIIKNEIESISQESIGESILSPPKSTEPLSNSDEAAITTIESPQLSPAIVNKLPSPPIKSEPLNNVENSAGSSSNINAIREDDTSKEISNKKSNKNKSCAINIHANGSMPKSGKPQMGAFNKKNKPRGRPKRKALVAMYQSEISVNKGIKLYIKKSDITPKQNRKRSRKSKHKDQETDSESGVSVEKKKRKDRSNNNTEKQKKTVADIKEPVEQTAWGIALPESVLYKIFQYSIHQEGCLPTLIRLGRVCHLWRTVSLSSSLWNNIDLNYWIKEKHRTELKLKWLIDNRLRGCKELNIGNWKISDIQCVLYKLADACPDLVGITLNDWKGFQSDHLKFLVENFKKLQRLDLSSINVEMKSAKSAVGLETLCNAITSFQGRLTHLLLAHNRLAGIPQIVTTLADACPNLNLLDLSNVQTIAYSHGIINIEKLQKGCQKLKVLRITNSQITLSQASLAEQMESPGFPELEELSVASLANESRIITDEFLQRILKTSTKLNLLDVRGCARLTHDSLIRLPAWDLKHLFLSGCSIAANRGSGLELIASKWAHSLTELDLAWANVKKPLENAIKVLAEKGADSPLVHLNLCGSSVSEESVKEILINCPVLNSINLSSCRGLPRGVKRLMQGPTELNELRDVLQVTVKINNNESSVEETK